MADKPKKCAHPACNCVCSDGQKYCSAYCHDSGKTMEIVCNCGHTDCGKP